MSNGRVRISADESLLGSDEERPRIDIDSRRRVVRMLPLDLPGVGRVLRPAIWTAPSKHFEEASGREVIAHVVLLRRGPPVDVAVVNVVADEVTNCPEDVVECEEVRAVDSLVTLPMAEEALKGSQRTVPLVPVPGGILCPCIWLSPYDLPDEDLRERVKIAVVLLSPGPQRPDVGAIRIPVSVVKKFPTGPVEW